MKHILYSNEARESLLSGVKKIATAVKVTLGPSGCNVLIRNEGENKPFATKDGVTVAGNISSSNPVEMMAIEAVCDVANMSDEIAGDGTTTATVLAEAIFEQSVSFESKLNLLEIKRGIDLATRHIVSELKELAVPCDSDEMLKQVALVSSNFDEEIASIVVDAFKVAGRQGVVNIKRSRTYDTYLSTIKGMTLPMGFTSIYYQTDFKNEICEYEDTYVFMTDAKITKLTPNLEALFTQIAENQDSILIICEDMDITVSDMLLRNKQNGSLKVCVCKAPGFGAEKIDTLQDLGTVLGKPPFLMNDGIDFESIPADEILDYLPRTEHVIVGKNQTSIKGALTDSEEELKRIEEEMEARADMLREKLEGHVNSYEKGIIQTRISRLSDGIAYINIAAFSDAEFIEKQHRVQDSLYAVKAANEEGIIPGGGTTLLSLSKTRMFNDKDLTDSVKVGIKILLNAIRVPFFQIIKNVGIDNNEYVDSVIEKIESNFNYGIDVRKNILVDDMIGAGIIDPVKVTRTALENASSIASLLISTECVIVDDSVYEKFKPTTSL